MQFYQNGPSYNCYHGTDLRTMTRTVTMQKTQVLYGYGRKGPDCIHVCYGVMLVFVTTQFEHLN